MFSFSDLSVYQVVEREFFAIRPRLTIHGWCWLADVREVRTFAPEHLPEGKWLWHYEKINVGDP